MNTKIHSIVLLGLLIAVSITLPACADTFTGKIAVKGNEPFTYLVLVTEKGDMKIVGSLQIKLRDNFQGKHVTVKGMVIKKGGGFMALPELEVTEIVNAAD
jgi:hypothetical protein